jgi:quercetin dioxygenase-like cupin family protein
VNVTPDIQIGRATLEPGWKWSEDVKPIAQTPSCHAEHNGYVVSGSLTIKMDDGQESVNLNAGDAFHIPPGHDAWVTGNQPCILLDFTGVKEYAKKKEEKKAA